MEFRADVPAARRAELAAFVADHGTTERVYRDLDRLRLRYEFVPMDEYTIDLVVPLPDRLVLVYYTT